jgi:hypothetical protein
MATESPAAVVVGSDGTEVKVQPASTTPAGTDPALTVTVSPNTAPVPVTDNGGSLTVDGPLTDAQLRAAAVPVSDGGGSLTVDGAVSVSNFPAVQPVSDNGGSLTTDTPQLPATLTGAGSLKAAVVESLPAGTNTVGKVDQGAGGASAWKVDGSAVTQPVSGPLTDTQLRASAVPISAASLPLPTGASTEATLLTLATDAVAQAIRDRLGALSTPVVGSVNAQLASLVSKDYATQTTLATLATQVTAAAIQAALEAIRDTAGIKKITDQLPAGSNTIGKVDQGTTPWIVMPSPEAAAQPQETSSNQHDMLASVQREMLDELRQIRTLLELLTDERVRDEDIET